MACEVDQYLPANDSSVLEVEQLVHQAGKYAIFRKPPKGRRRFSVQSKTRLHVESSAGQLMVLDGYESQGHVYVELRMGKLILRKLHTHSGHRNPDSKEEVDGVHMHFPSRRFPLLKDRRSHAYRIDAEIDCVADGLQLFCLLTNIEVEGIQAYLG